MSKIDELFSAVKANNLEMVKKLIQYPDIDINTLQIIKTPTLGEFDSFIGTVLHVAALNNNPEIMRLLIDKGADLEMGKYKWLPTSPVSPLCLIVSELKSSRDAAASLLLRSGASLDITPVGTSQKNLVDGLFSKSRLNHLSNSFRQVFLHEALIRGEEMIVNEMLSHGLQITLNYFEDQLGDRKIKTFDIHKAEQLINKLSVAKTLDRETAQILITKLRSAHDLSINPNAYPKCLKVYLENKQMTHISKIPLPKLIAELQFSRGNIPTPKTIEEINDILNKGESGEYQKYLTIFEKNPGLLDIKNLIDFIDPLQAPSSIVELHFRGEELISSLCAMAINENLSEEQRNACIILLTKYENLGDFESIVLNSAKHNLEFSQALAKGVEQFSSQVNENFEEANKNIDQLTQQNQFLLKILETINQQNQTLQNSVSTLVADVKILKDQLTGFTGKRKLSESLDQQDSKEKKPRKFMF